MPSETRPLSGAPIVPTVPVIPSVGVPASAAPGVVLGVQPQEQVGNGCGTTSLAMAMTYSTGRQYTQTMVDADIRLTDIFTSASNMKSFANDKGMAARLVNNLSDKEVIENIDKKRPILFLTDLTPENSSDIATMHWRVIDGYRWDGGKLMLHIVDPWNRVYEKSWDDLAPEWNNIKAVGLQSGYNRFGVILGANPADRVLGADRMDGVFATEGVIDGAADTVNDAVKVSHGKIWYFFNAIWDGLRTFFSALLYPFQLLFGHVDHSAGKTASPPAEPAPLAPVTDHSRPKIVRELPAGTRKAASVAWWDGGDHAGLKGQYIVNIPPARPKTLEGLQPPATKKPSASMG